MAGKKKLDLHVRVEHVNYFCPRVKCDLKKKKRKKKSNAVPVREGCPLHVHIVCVYNMHVVI